MDFFSMKTIILNFVCIFFFFLVCGWVVFLSDNFVALLQYFVKLVCMQNMYVERVSASIQWRKKATAKKHDSSECGMF